MKKIGIRILGCMALLSMVGCGRIEGASVQDLSNTKDAIVESETTLAENNNAGASTHLTMPTTLEV